MVEIPLIVLCFSGYVYAASRWGKINFSYAPLFSVSFLGILLFVFALSNQLKQGALFLMYAGFFLSAICIIDAWCNRKTTIFFLPVRLYLVLVILIIVSCIVPFGMRFTVIDDYVYWGIMGKYLYLTHNLPGHNTAIIARHLAYTPGSSLFHYFFYTLTGTYKPAVSYAAQNLLLISALFVVLKDKAIKRTLIFLFMLIVLLTLFSGSVFSKLQVDYLLSTYCFAIFWIYFREPLGLSGLLTISIPICFLFLIKEIGFVLGIFILIIFLLDLIFYEDLDRKTRLKFILFLFFAGSMLFFLKQIWTNHCRAMGFLEFNTAVNLESIKHSLQIFSDEKICKGFMIFMKAVLIGPADRLNLPYLLWYLSLIFFWIKIRNKTSIKKWARYARFLKISGILFFLYLVLLYFLQTIIFNVGTNFDHTIGLTRYLNIFFSQVVFFTILSYMDLYFFHYKLSNKMMCSLVILILLILGLSRFETSLHREKHYLEAEQIANKIENNIDGTKINRICVVPGINDNHLGIKLLYHLLPNRVNPGKFPVQNLSAFLSNLAEYDYVLFNHPDADMMQWINPLVDKPFGIRGFFMIRSDEMPRDGKEKQLRLKRIF